jgi:hypothetical protein
VPLYRTVIVAVPDPVFIGTCALIWADDTKSRGHRIPFTVTVVPLALVGSGNENPLIVPPAMLFPKMYVGEPTT